MKKVIGFVASKLESVFGYGIMICLFAGGFTFFGYLAALIIGGNVASVICEVIYKSVFPVIIKAASILVIIGLIIMYLKGEKALMASKGKR